MSRSSSSLVPTLLLALSLAPSVHGDPLPPGAIARLGTMRLRHGGPVRAVAFSPDGKTVASAAYDKTVRLWDVRSGSEIRRFTGLESPECVAFAPDGKTLAAGDYKKPFSICVWKTATGKLLQKCDGHGEPVLSVAFAPKGDVLASGSWDKTIRLWEVATGRQLRLLQDDNDGVNVVAFAPDGKTLASGSRALNGEQVDIALWDVATGQRTRSLEGHRRAITGLAFTAGGTLLQSAGKDWTQRLWDLQTGRELLQFTDQGQEMAVSADGKVLACLIPAKDTQEIRIREAQSGKERQRFPIHHLEPNAVALSPDGTMLATSGNTDCTLSLWDVATGKPLLALGRHLGPVRDVVYFPDGRTVASASDDGTVRLWDTVSWTERRCLSMGHLHARCLAVSAEGRFLAAGGSQGSLYLWDLSGADEPRRMQTRNESVYSLAFAPDGKTLACAARRAGVLLYSTATGELVRGFDPPQQYSWAVAFSADGRLLASGDQRGQIHLLDPATGKELRLLEKDFDSAACCVAFSSDGGILASIGLDGGAYFWNPADGKPIRSLEPQLKDSGLAFALGGRILATGGRDGIVRIWETATGKERRRFVGHQGSVFAVAFAPDGRTLVSAGEDTSLLVWDMTSRPRELDPNVPLLLDRQEMLWAALAGTDAGLAYQALWQLAQAPRETVALLRQQLDSIRLPSREQLARLIADLDNDDFAVRERASAELEQLGEAAEAALRNLLKDSPSVETRVRVEQLLAKREKAEIPPHELRILRALELLEQLGTADARQLLEAMAQGAPAARPTKEAKQSLERLAKHQKSGR